LRRNEAQKE
jgi:hypothetical protein